MGEDLTAPAVSGVATAGGTVTRSLRGGARMCWSGRADGDMAGSGHGVAARRRSLVDLPWSVLRQVHGARVEIVRSPGGGYGRGADAAVTDVRGAALAVLTADCAPVALACDAGVIGVAHAGWRGLAAGVVEATAEAMRALGADAIEAVIGPCIGVECYAFGAEDLETVAAATGPEVRGRCRDGRPALDLAAGVRTALGRAGVGVEDVGVCTSCSAGLWSWRARADQCRQATVVWLP